MKKLFLLTVLTLITVPTFSQSLHVDSTRFITGYQGSTGIYNAITTVDNGILFVGSSASDPGGIIPSFPLDVSYRGNLMIGKIDNYQQISWIKTYGGSREDGGGPICKTLDGGYAVLAGTSSNDGDVTGFKGGADFWLLRIDGNGNLLWQKTYGSTAGDGAVSIANTPDHGFIMLGLTNGDDYDVPFHYGGPTSQDWLVIKVDSMGNMQWSKTVGGSGDEEGGTVLCIDDAYYIVGYSRSKDHDCIDTAWHANVKTDFDIHVLKLDNFGNTLWDKSFGGSNYELAQSAIFDVRDSTIVIAGTTASSDYMVTEYHGGQTDIWLIKINKEGDLVWQQTLGGEKDEVGIDVCITSGGGYIIAGSTYPGSSGGKDIQLLKVDQTGQLITSKIFGGSESDDVFSIIPYLNGYAIAGISGSRSLSEGSVYGLFNARGGGAFVSYLDSGILATINLPIDMDHLIASPNPCNETARIFLPAEHCNKLTILNATGQTVYANSSLNSPDVNINTKEWAPGLYIIQSVTEDGQITTTKLVKN